MFNREQRCYDAVYTCTACMKRLRFRKEGGRLIGKVLDEKNTYWIFSDMTGNSFHWEYITGEPDGAHTLVCEIHGKRIA